MVNACAGQCHLKNCFCHSTFMNKLCCCFQSQYDHLVSNNANNDTEPTPKVQLPIQNVPPKPEVMQTNTLLPIKSPDNHFKKVYYLREKLGHGRFGTVFLSVEKATGKEYACKLIEKNKLITQEDFKDVTKEIQIMHHLTANPNVASIRDAYEDSEAVYIVMELCRGGELFDRIKERGRYAERKAAELFQTIIEVIQSFHSSGVLHRDLKAENFLFLDHQEDSPLKIIDFGLSTFFKRGENFSYSVGSLYYVAPEVLQKDYGPEADIWSAGVILYVLLSGVPPFWGETEKKIHQEVLHSDLDFISDPWPVISVNAKDLVRRMLDRNPATRITIAEVLCHPWIRTDRIAPNKPLYSSTSENKLKKPTEDGLKEVVKITDA